VQRNFSRFPCPDPATVIVARAHAVAVPTSCARCDAERGRTATAVIRIAGQIVHYGPANSRRWRRVA
jgi:hypothetical protein